MRPHGINQYSFLVYLSGLRSKVTVTFWTSLSLASLSAYCALIPASCSSGYDFAIPSSRLHLTVQTLGVAFGLVGNYLPYGLSPQDIDMPVVLKNGHSKADRREAANLKFREPHYSERTS